MMARIRSSNVCQIGVPQGENRMGQGQFSKI